MANKGRYTRDRNSIFRCTQMGQLGVTIREIESLVYVCVCARDVDTRNYHDIIQWTSYERN